MGPPSPFWSSQTSGLHSCEEGDIGSSSSGVSPVLLLIPLPTCALPSLPYLKALSPWALARPFSLPSLPCYIWVRRTQSTWGPKLRIQIGGQSLGEGSLSSPGTGLAPCACQCRTPGSGPGQERQPNWGVRGGRGAGAGQLWGWAASWHLVLDLFFPSQYQPPYPSCLLSGSSSSQFLGPTPLPAPIPCPRSPAARLLPAHCQPPGAPSRPMAGLGSHKGTIELRAPGPGCIKELVSSRGSRGLPQAQVGCVLGSAYVGDCWRVQGLQPTGRVIPLIPPHLWAPTLTSSPNPTPGIPVPFCGGPGPDMTPVPHPTDSETI